MIASNFKQCNSCIKALFVLLTKNLNTISFWNMKRIQIETTKLDFIRTCSTLEALKQKWYILWIIIRNVLLFFF